MRRYYFILVLILISSFTLNQIEILKKESQNKIIRCTLEQSESFLYNSRDDNFTILEEFTVTDFLNIYKCDKYGKVRQIGHILSGENLLDFQLIRRRNEVYSFQIEDDKIINKKRIFNCNLEFPILRSVAYSDGRVAFVCNSNNQQSVESQITVGTLKNENFKVQKIFRNHKEVKKVKLNDGKVLVQENSQIVDLVNNDFYQKKIGYLREVITDFEIHNNQLYILFGDNSLSIYKEGEVKYFDAIIKETFPLKIIGQLNRECVIQYNNLESYLIKKDRKVFLGEIKKIITGKNVIFIN
jgi:hypothetical protein